VPTQDERTCLEIIDAHGHLGTSPILQQYTFPPISCYLGENCVKDMDDEGIHKAVVFPLGQSGGNFSESNNMIASEVRKFPNRLIGFCRVNPNFGREECVREIRRAVKGLGLKGLKLNPYLEWHYPNSELVHGIMEEVQRLRIPLLYHSGMTFNSSPALIGDLAADYPETKIIMAHIGNYEWAEDAIAVAKRQDNLYVDTSGVTGTFFIKKAVKILGKHRVLFGTDRPFNPAELEMSKITKYCRFSRDEKRAIFSENVSAILNIN
jgi:predicted TIM-barrel fold metal-dependent hydrolase